MRNLTADLSPGMLDHLGMRARSRPCVPIGRIPIAKSAKWIVTIEGKPYCGFDKKGDARVAMDKWRIGWDAVYGKRMAIVPAPGALV